MIKKRRAPKRRPKVRPKSGRVEDPPVGGTAAPQRSGGSLRLERGKDSKPSVTRS